MEREVRKILINLITACNLCLRASGMREKVYEDTLGYSGGCPFLRGYDCPLVKRTIDDLSLLLNRGIKINRQEIGQLIEQLRMLLSMTP